MSATEVEFGSLLTYTPRGTSEKAREAITTMTYLKGDKVTDSNILMSEYLARMIKKDIHKFPFADYFNSKTILIPAPKGSLCKSGTLWVPKQLTTALVKNGLGRSSEPCLERIKPVSKSSGQQDGSKRPTALQHYKSMNIQKLLFEPEDIILLDDVITRGATIMGGVNRLREAFPNSKIRAFTMRVISNVKDFVDVKEPCIGKITMDGKYTRRIP